MNNCDKNGDLMWFNYGKMVIFVGEKKQNSLFCGLIPY